MGWQFGHEYFLPSSEPEEESEEDNAERKKQ